MCGLNKIVVGVALLLAGCATPNVVTLSGVVTSNKAGIDDYISTIVINYDTNEVQFEDSIYMWIEDCGNEEYQCWTTALFELALPRGLDHSVKTWAHGKYVYNSVVENERQDLIRIGAKSVRGAARDQEILYSLKSGLQQITVNIGGFDDELISVTYSR